MAITPRQAKSLTDDQRQALRRLEVKIDDILQAEYWGEGKVTINFESIGLSTISERVKDALIALYKEAGWSVTYHSDQRDGLWFEFEPWSKKS